MDIEPKNDSLKVLAGQYRLYVKDYDQSLKYLNEALKLDVFNARAYFLKGIVYKEKKDINKAISSLQTAVEQYPEFYDADMPAGLLYADIGKIISTQLLQECTECKSE
jgi:tetratricopeptide (TPR) repeat protein